ncbi:MAG TPA: farnesyl diphosphate synthase [Tepidisphaeraceae bacterium]|nr:farnesyl diphosphate synthase [Tepidisphaeraceae bacterium]
MSQSSPSSLGAVEILKNHGDTVNGFFRVLRDRYADSPARLLDAIEYSVMAGGKRLRPALVLECFLACAGRNPRDPGHKSAVAAAAAIELIHTFSLVHDDLPAMDDDDLRRGRPTNHKVFGEAMAILAGDAMVTVAFEILAADADPAVLPAMIHAIASASGPQGMIGGQALDMENENARLSLPDLQRVHRMKTGALLTASCRLGALAARGEQCLQAVTEFGRHLGLAFQIVDDVLDVTSTPEQMGKATRKDAGKGKNTYPSLLGLEASRREAQAQLSQALASLDPLGAAANGLRAMARFVVERNN